MQSHTFKVTIIVSGPGIAPRDMSFEMRAPNHMVTCADQFSSIIMKLVDAKLSIAEERFAEPEVKNPILAG